MARLVKGGIVSESIRAEIDRLLREGTLEHRRNPQRCADMLLHALHLVRKIHLPHKEAEILASLGECRRLLREFDTAIDLWHQAMELYARIADQAGRARAFNGLGLCYWELARYPEAFAHLHRALEILQELPLDWFSAVIHNSLALVFISLGDYKQALVHFFRCLEINTAIGHNLGISMACKNIGGAYAELNDSENALKYLLQGLEHTEKSRDTHGTIIALKTIGQVHIRQRQAQEALDVFRQAAALNQTMGRAPWPELLADTALALAMTDADGQAERFIQEALGLLAAESNPKEKARAYECLARAYSELGNNAAAIALREECLTFFEHSNTDSMALNVCANLARNYAGTENYAKAYEYQQRADTLREKIFAAERRREIYAMNVRKEIEVLEQDRQLLNQRLALSREENERRGRELDAAALQLLQRNQALQTLHNSLEELGRQAKGVAKSDVKTLLDFIRGTLEDRSEWHLFDSHIEHAHREFISRLLHAAPRLTPAEIRICCLLRLNLPSKQMAAVLYSSVETVKTHRRHIRRKLGIQPGANLVRYLQSL